MHRSSLLKYYLFCVSLFSGVMMTNAQQTSAKYRFLLDLGYSLNGSGDFEGGHGGFGVQQHLYKHFSLQYQAQVTIHSGSAVGFTTTDPTTGVSYGPPYFVITGVQLSALPVWHVFGHKNQ